MKKKLNTQLATFAALLVCVGVSTSAQAQTIQVGDTKSFHGTSCTELYDTAPEIMYSQQGAQNSATWQNEWICPVVRDFVGSGMDVTDWDISVTRGSSTKAWNIKLWSTNRAGTSGWKSTITVPAGSAYRNLDGGTISSGYSSGVLYIYSYVPDGARIHSYTVSEHS